MFINKIDMTKLTVFYVVAPVSFVIHLCTILQLFFETPKPFRVLLG